MLKRYFSNLSRAVAGLGQQFSKQQLLITLTSAVVMLVALVVFWNSFILPQHISKGGSGTSLPRQQSAALKADSGSVPDVASDLHSQNKPGYEWGAVKKQDNVEGLSAGKQGGAAERGTVAGQGDAGGPTALVKAGKENLSGEANIPLEPDMSQGMKPVAGSLIKASGFVLSPTFHDYRFHKGIDIAAPRGAQVKCILEGVVEGIDYSQGEGRSITINHGGGWKSKYSHLEAVKLKKGAAVKAGDVLGVLGEPGGLEAAEGCHLHLEMLKDGAQVNPLEFLDY